MWVPSYSFAVQVDFVEMVMTPAAILTVRKITAVVQETFLRATGLRTAGPDAMAGADPRTATRPAMPPLALTTSRTLVCGHMAHAAAPEGMNFQQSSLLFPMLTILDFAEVLLRTAKRAAKAVVIVVTFRTQHLLLLLLLELHLRAPDLLKAHPTVFQ